MRAGSALFGLGVVALTLRACLLPDFANVESEALGGSGGTGAAPNSGGSSGGSGAQSNSDSSVSGGASGNGGNTSGAGGTTGGVGASAGTGGATGATGGGGSGGVVGTGGSLGSTGTGGSAGNSGAGGSSGTMAGASGSGGTTGGSSGSGGAGGASCPPTAPTAGTSCPAFLYCNYGGVRTCYCNGPNWACYNCPTNRPISSSSCGSYPVNMRCEYPQSWVCICEALTGWRCGQV